MRSRQSTRRRSKRPRDSVDTETPTITIKEVDTPATAALRRLTGCAIIVLLEFPLRQFYISYAKKRPEKYNLILRTDINPKPILWLATMHNILYHLVRNKKAIFEQPKKWFNYQPTAGQDQHSQVAREGAAGETEHQENETTKTNADEADNVNISTDATDGTDASADVTDGGEPRVGYPVQPMVLPKIPLEKPDDREDIELESMKTLAIKRFFGQTLIIIQQLMYDYYDVTKHPDQFVYSTVNINGYKIFKSSTWMVLYWIVWQAVDAKVEVGNQSRKLLMLVPAFFILKQGFHVFSEIILEQKKAPTTTQEVAVVE